MRTGLVLGRFLPPHLGHQYVFDFAQNYVDELWLVIASMDSDPIDADARLSWLQEMAPRAHLLHINLQEHDHFFSPTWAQALRTVLPFIPNYLFASADYGEQLAELLGMQYIPVNHSHSLVPITSAKLRSNPLSYWQYIPPCVRPYIIINGSWEERLTKAINAVENLLTVGAGADDVAGLEPLGRPSQEIPKTSME